MSTFRKKLKKWLYGSCPGFAGRFPYFGTRVYFPKNSHLFLRTCEEGIFESENIRLLQKLFRSNTVMFDIGANIGLISIPILKKHPDAKVVSFEPSPNSLPFLQRTVKESIYSNRWKVIPKAVGNKCGKTVFKLSKIEDGAFDGIRETNQTRAIREVYVDLTTIDFEWMQLNKPEVSIIKCDVEGAELLVIEGAAECIKTTKPYILIEFEPENFISYDYTSQDIFNLCREMNLSIYSIPHLIRINSNEEFTLHLLKTNSYLLTPAK